MATAELQIILCVISTDADTARYDCRNNKPCKGELTTDDIEHGGQHYQYPYNGDVSI